MKRNETSGRWLKFSCITPQWAEVELQIWRISYHMSSIRRGIKFSSQNTLKCYAFKMVCVCIYNMFKQMYQIPAMQIVSDSD